MLFYTNNALAMRSAITKQNPLESFHQAIEPRSVPTHDIQRNTAVYDLFISFSPAGNSWQATQNQTLFVLLAHNSSLAADACGNKRAAGTKHMQEPMQQLSCWRLP